jgi:hypothetical protein
LLRWVSKNITMCPSPLGTFAILHMSFCFHLLRRHFRVRGFQLRLLIP